MTIHLTTLSIKTVVQLPTNVDTTAAEAKEKEEESHHHHPPMMEEPKVVLVGIDVWDVSGTGLSTDVGKVTRLLMSLTRAFVRSVGRWQFKIWSGKTRRPAMAYKLFSGMKIVESK